MSRRWLRSLLLVGLCLWAPLASDAEFVNGDLIVVGVYNRCAPATASGTTYACTIGTAPQNQTSYGTGTLYAFRADVANTGAATINFNGLGAKSIVKMLGGTTTALSANDIRAGQEVLLVYDGTNMEMVSQPGTGVTAPTGSIVGTGQANTWTTGAQDMGAATSFKVPTSAGAAPTASGLLAYDSTANAFEGGINGTTAQLLTTTSTVVRSVTIDAGGMDVEGACALGTAAALVTNGPKLPAITCTDVDTDGIDFTWIMPDGWNGGTITVELDVFYTGTTHNTQIFDMNFSGQCVRHGDAVAAWAITSGATAESSSNVEVQVTASGTANRELKVASGAITLSGTCTGGTGAPRVYMHGLVDATSTTFTPMTELKILGIKVEYTRSMND